jgi:hypothetical protein
MAVTYTFTKESQCAGGNHLVVSVTDGTNVRRLHVDTEYMRSPITESEIEAAFKVLARRAIAGLTLAQAAAKINTGFSVAID